MSKNPNGLLLFVDELFSLFESFDKKSMNGLRHMLKTAWSADMAQTQDRIKRGTIRADHTCISVFGTIQPALLDKLAKAGILDNLMFWSEDDREGYEEAITKALVNFFCGKMEGIQ